MKIDAKRLPKWSQNRCQNASRIDARTGIEKDQENHEKSCFTERVKLLFKNRVREVSSEVKARTGKASKKTSEMRSKSIPKSMQNRYKFHTRKSYAKNTGNHPKWSPKGSQKPSKNLSKIDSKKRSIFSIFFQECLVDLLPDKTTQIQQDT